MANPNPASPNAGMTEEERLAAEWINDLCFGPVSSIPSPPNPRLKTPFSAAPTSTVLAFPAGGRRSS